MSISQADGDPLIHELEALLDEGVVVERARTEYAIPSADSLQVLMPRYEVRGLLGAGGMGQVFDAFDTQLQRRVAIKVVARGGPLIADLMRRERKILAALDHPGIVGVFDGGELPDGQPYYVMQFIEGADLRNYAHSASLALPEKLRLVAEIARAVGVAHLLKVVHRDLKPSNIKVGASGRPMVLDFGLAKFAAAHEIEPLADEEPGTFQTVASGKIKGTLAYMSPEQAAGERVDSRSDVYALGVILHELLTGRLPYDPLAGGSTPLEWSRRLRSARKPELQLAGDLPRAVRAIIDKCLAAEAAERYPTAIELADDLHAYLASRAVSAVRSLRTLHVATAFARRNRRWIALAGLIAALLVTTVAVAFVKIREQRNVAEANAVRALREQQRAIERENDARRYLYAADVGQALRLWQNRQSDKAQALLDRYQPSADRPDLRSFEWRFVQGLCDRRPLILSGHTAPATAVRYSPDTSRVASADAAGGVRIWDAATGRTLHALSANRSEIRGLGFLASGEMLFTIGADRMLRLWDLAKEEQLRQHWWLLRPLVAVTASPDGSQIAVGDSGGWVYLWEPSTGRTLGHIVAHRDRGLRSLAYSPDGKLLATGGKDQTAKVWNATTRQLVASLQPHLGPIDALAFSPDGTRLATGGTDRMLRIWNFSEPASLPVEWRASDEIVALGFHAGGERLWAASKNGTVTLLAADGTRRHSIHAEVSRLQAADVTPDLARIASTAGDATLELLTASDLDEFTRLETGNRLLPARLALNRAGTWLAVCYFHQPLVEVWDLARGERISRLTGFAQQVTAIEFSPRDDSLLTTDMSGAALRWNVETAKVIGPLPASKLFRTAAAHAPRFEASAIADAGGRIEFYNEHDGRLLVTLSGHEKMPIVDLQFSADGHWLASAGWDKTIHIWDLEQGKLTHVLRGHQGIVHTVRFSPDGQQLASSSADGTVRLWDFAQGAELVTLCRQPHEIFGLAYSRDGRTIAAACGDRTEGGSSLIRLWNIATQQETISLEVPASQVAGLVFTEHDRQLLAGAGPGLEDSAILQFQARQVDAQDSATEVAR